MTELRVWQAASVLLGVTSSCASVVALGVAVFGGASTAYVVAAVAVALAVVRDLLERFASRRLEIDPRPAYAAAPLDESARRTTRRLMILSPLPAALVAAAALLDSEFVPVAIVLAVTLALLVWDLGRVLRQGSYVALTRLVLPPPDR